MNAATRFAFTAFVTVVIVLGQGGLVQIAAAQARQTREIPKFEVDPSWPKLPGKWVFGQVSSVSIDAQGHAWVLQRPTTVRTDQKDERTLRCRRLRQQARDRVRCGHRRI
jgi:hypothetical protein